MIQRNNIVSRLCGFIISFVLSIVVICTTWSLHISYDNTIRYFSVVIVIIWGYLLIRSKGLRDYSVSQIVLICLLIFGLACYMGSAWHRGYFSDTPLIEINAEDGGFTSDTLYHSTIASSMAYYGYPSLLINKASFHNYHFGSHLVLGWIARIMGIPTIFSYCYIYPLIFFPLFPSLILSVGSGLKGILKREEKIATSDVCLLVFFASYCIIPQSWSDELANWKYSWLVSESFCVAIVFFLAFFRLVLYFYSSGYYSNKTLYRLFIWIAIPFFIIITCLTKISVGLILAFIVSYYMFRKRGIDIKYLILEAYYVILAFLVHFIPSLIPSAISSATSTMSPDWFDFLKKYVRHSELWGLHVLCFFFFSFVFISYRIRNISSLKELADHILNKELISEEILFWVCILGALPGIVFSIVGGSGYYFMAVEQVAAVVLLIGYSIPFELIDALKTRCRIDEKLGYRIAIGFFVACISVNYLVSSIYYAKMIWFDCHQGELQKEEVVKKDSYWGIVNQINETTNGNKKDFYIYVSPSASVWNKYESIGSALFFYPAMTGIVCIGEIYIENGRLYANNGCPVSEEYNSLVEEEGRMTEEDAIRIAKRDNKTAVFLIHDNTVSIEFIQ